MNKRKVYEGIEAHENPGMYIRFADQVTLDNCSVKLGNLSSSNKCKTNI
jgi:hypothetical protein